MIFLCVYWPILPMKTNNRKKYQQAIYVDRPEQDTEIPNNRTHTKNCEIDGKQNRILDTVCIYPVSIGDAAVFEDPLRHHIRWYSILNSCHSIPKHIPT